MADDEVVLEGNEGGARIRLHSPEYVNAADGERVLDSVTIAVESPRVEFSARATSCVLVPLSTYQLDELLGGFATVAEPWTCEPAWSAELQGAGFVHLRAKCDRLGHVRLSVEVEDYGTVEWKGTAHVVFDLGQAKSLGSRIRALVRPDSPW